MKKHQNIVTFNHLYRVKLIKLFLILFAAVYFFGCKKDLSKADNRDANSNETTFTITNKANNNEEVYIYLKNKINKTPINSYKLRQAECLKLTTSQFKPLVVTLGNGGDVGIVRVIKSFGTTDVCSPNLPICEPDNYEIINKEGMIGDRYIMVSVNHLNTNDNCVGIEQWMESK